MKNISFETTDQNYLITIDRDLMDNDTFYTFFERLRIEYLASKMNTNENDLLELSEEIKSNWWKKNEDKIMKKINNYSAK